MRRILLFIMILIVGLASCTKVVERPLPPIDESYWLSKERGVVVESDIHCRFVVAETYRGYAILETWSGNRPFRGDVLYGDFSNWGVRNIYNRSAGYLFQADVRDYWLSYWDALDQLQWLCRF